MNFDGQRYVSHDASGEIDVEANPGVSTDSNEGYVFDWDAQPHVDADQLPDAYTQFYDAEEFVVLNDVTIAKPIVQTYHVNGDEYQFAKTPSELKRAAWSFDNKPHTLNHPDSGRVRSVDDIHGFWKDPAYANDEDGIQSDLYIPANDMEALSYVSEHGDVSIGFTNKLVQSDEEGVDAIQTDIYGDHVASVPVGRCSGEDGCGLNADASTVNVSVPVADHDASGQTFDTTDTIMTDGTCDCGGQTDGQLDLGDALGGMTVDALAKRNDNIAELQSEKAELQSDADDLRERLERVESALDAEEDVSLMDEIEALSADAQRLEDAQSELEEYQRSEFDSLVSEITDMTDMTEDDFSFEDDSIEDLREKREFLDSVEGTPTEANPDATTDSTAGGSAGPSPDEGGLEPTYEPQY